MGGPFAVACVFCFFCCAHVNCFSHNDNQLGGANKKPIWTDNKADFIHKVFEKYGDGEIISLQGFEKLLREIKLENLILPQNLSPSNSHVKNSTHNITQNVPHIHEDARLPQCISSTSLLSGSIHLTPSMYRDVCPVLLSQLMPISLNMSPQVCQHHSTGDLPADDRSTVWLYSTLSIIIISLCGLLGVAVIPVMQLVFYHQLLQFLVALAVGTLCGDALLHLLPHAMMATHSHHTTVHMGQLDVESHMDDHDANIWRGLVAMLGVVFFYFTEKCLTMVAECRKKKQRKTQLMPKVRVMRDVDSPTGGTKVGEKLCKHKYSSYPYCYGEIADNPDNHQKVRNNDQTETNAVCKSMVSNQNGDDSLFEKKCLNINAPDLTKENELLSTQKALLDGNDENQSDERYTVIIREHENVHHGHSHTHGHVHSAPQSMSSVAWMVIMGDGLHNFTDGMAIGAAFSSNVTGGFSTALAVFCHELPHELGDFAVLLKAGMSAKQAVFYNMLSSILCFVGMCFGIFLGHDEHMTQWVFAAAAGMFLYIALVDMIPELTTSHSNEGGSLCQCVLHFAGLMTGIAIMLLIAVYEHDLKTVFDK
ncbi:zinc transporter foi-like [Macrosteles quadrilineatus]|uniref:zinc transporter foi-like n=1 Tax=Macrosteles quadrilineatus TaxID=74068 RepID=UPI0023E2FCAF|nr:zinc transporter foi-like [Macrosteles quadrilineatus]